MRASPFLLAALLAALPATAAPPPTTLDAAPAFTAAAFKAHVEFLSDDLLEGRDAGSRGYDLAARYVATRFEALGLKFAPGARGWYQPVSLAEARLAAAPATLTIDGKRFDNGGAVVMGPSLREPAQALSAGAVFVGFGIASTKLGIDDYAGIDVRGKFAVVLSGFPKGTPSDIGAHLNAEKAALAERHGAIGLITIYTRESLSRRPWTTIQTYAANPAVSWSGEDGKPYLRAPGIRATASLDTPAAEALFAGAPRSLASVLAEADATGARPKGFALGRTVAIQRRSTVSTVKSENVVAILPGSDPALAGEYVLLMAHLDHLGSDPKKTGDQVFNGAMDNASGVSTLLEVARAMAAGPAPRRSILFAAVTGEEDGLLGAHYLARNPIVGAGKVVGVVNLDMPVLLYDFSDVIAFGAEHSTLGPIVARATAKAGVALSPDPLPAEGLFTRSDHYRFVQEGVPSVFLMTGFAGKGAASFEDFLKTHYHKVSDEADLPFDWQAGAKFARINYLIAREIADADRAPRWYEGSFFGDTFAPAAPKAARP